MNEWLSTNAGSDYLSVIKISMSAWKSLAISWGESTVCLSCACKWCVFPVPSPSSAKVTSFWAGCSGERERERENRKVKCSGLECLCCASSDANVFSQATDEDASKSTLKRVSLWALRREGEERLRGEKKNDHRDCLRIRHWWRWLNVERAGLEGRRERMMTGKKLRLWKEGKERREEEQVSLLISWSHLSAS